MCSNGNFCSDNCPKLHPKQVTCKKWIERNCNDANCKYRHLYGAICRNLQKFGRCEKNEQKRCGFSHNLVTKVETVQKVDKVDKVDKVSKNTELNITDKSINKGWVDFNLKKKQYVKTEFKNKSVVQKTEPTFKIIAIGVTLPIEWDCSHLDKIDISIIRIDGVELKEEINATLLRRNETELFNGEYQERFNIYATEIDNLPMSRSIKFIVKNIKNYQSQSGFCLFVEDDKYDVNFLGHTNTLSILEFSQESIAAFVCLK